MKNPFSPIRSPFFTCSNLESEHKQHKYMIIDFDVCCNCYREEILNFFGFWKYCCPACGARKSFTRHATYERNICYMKNNECVGMRITVLRLLCSSCGTTHAILPSGTIPFCYYPISCVIYFLSEFLIEKNSIPKISDKLSLVPATVHLYWLKYLLGLISCISFLRAFLLVSDVECSSPTDVLSTIKSSFSPETFLKEYFLHTKQIFLMTRRRFNLSRYLYIGI